MSLEAKIEDLTAAVENLAFIIKQSTAMTQGVHVGPTQEEYLKKHREEWAKADAEVKSKQQNVYAPLRTDEEVKGVTVTETKAPPVVSVPATPIAAPTVAMPGLPTFAPPPGPKAPTAPFNDAKGLMDYLMKSYTTLGAEKGAKIQEVMKVLGATAVNEVKPEQYDALFAGVEALK